MRFGWVSRSSSDKNLNAHVKTLAGQDTNYTLDPSHLRVEDLLIGRSDDPDIAIITADSAGKFFLSIGTSDGKLESKELDIPIGSKIGLRCFWGSDGQVCLAYQGPNGLVCLETHPSRQTIIPNITRYDGLFISGNARQVLFFPHSGPGESGRIYDHNWDGVIRQVLAGTGGYAIQPLLPLELSQNHSHPCSFPVVILSARKSLLPWSTSMESSTERFFIGVMDICAILLGYTIQSKERKFSLEIDTFCWSATSEKLDQTLAGESL